jgi:hypothetical protein
MKKRHEQKMLAASVLLLLLFNAPLLYAYNVKQQICGIPVFYFTVFTIWFISVLYSYIVLKKYYE